jgi:hypothetical protein
VTRVSTGFEITLLEKEGGPLTKRIGLVGGTLRNNSSQCLMSTGWATRVRCESVTNLAELINRCGPREAIAIGRLKEGLAAKVRIVRKGKLSELPGAVARCLESFEFASGPGVCLLDVDLKGAPEGLDALDALILSCQIWTSPRTCRGRLPLSGSRTRTAARLIPVRAGSTFSCSSKINATANASSKIFKTVYGSPASAGGSFRPRVPIWCARRSTSPLARLSALCSRARRSWRSRSSRPIDGRR